MRVYKLLSVFYFIVFFASALYAQEIKTPQWRVNEQCKCNVTENHWTITSLGNDPFLELFDFPEISEPVSLQFRMQAKASGGGQVFWNTVEQPRYLPDESTKFAITHNNTWQNYKIDLPITGSLKSLRFDPCSAAGVIKIEGLCLVTQKGKMVAQWLPLQLPESLSGNATIRAPVGDSEIVITTTSRLAGAIHSLTWNGKEFIDSVDHGRQLQSACSFAKNANPFHAECYNPTEAGSRLDAAGSHSSSQLLDIITTKHALQTQTRMAFWLAPWEHSNDKAALNKEPVSQHVLSKQVTIGYKNMPHVIQYAVTFRVPVTEQTTFAQFESLTGYMPAEFNHFWKFNTQANTLEKLSNTNGEQPFPVVAATANGNYAMAVYSPGHGNKQMRGPSYGRFDFQEQSVMKWNCVYRLREQNGIQPGEYSFFHYVIVGNIATITDSLKQLHTEHARQVPVP
jgi:hypothetical protein